MFESEAGIDEWRCRCIGICRKVTGDMVDSILREDGVLKEGRIVRELTSSYMTRGMIVHWN